VSQEPIGVMKCWECVEKHARDMEHHLEDIVRESRGVMRMKYEEWIDQIREMRRQAHQMAKGIDTGADWERLGETMRRIKEAGRKIAPSPEGEFGEPLHKPKVEVGEHVWVERDVAITEEECDPKSFRVIKPNPQHIITICCPLNHFDEKAGRCLVGTRAYKIEHLHPPGQGSCPVCQG